MALYHLWTYVYARRRTFIVIQGTSAQSSDFGWIQLFCLFVLPDYPTNCKIWYITEQERQIALRRSVNAGRTEVTGHVSTALFKKMFGRWKWWLLVIAYLFYGSSCQANSYFAIYLSAF